MKKEIISFVESISYLSLEDEDNLQFATRDNGDVGDEEFGIEDYNHAIATKIKILKEFTTGVVTVDTVDEWVTLAIKER